MSIGFIGDLHADTNGVLYLRDPFFTFFLGDREFVVQYCNLEFNSWSYLFFIFGYGTLSVFEFLLYEFKFTLEIFSLAYGLQGLWIHGMKLTLQILQFLLKFIVKVHPWGARWLLSGLFGRLLLLWLYLLLPLLPLLQFIDDCHHLLDLVPHLVDDLFEHINLHVFLLVLVVHYGHQRLTEMVQELLTQIGGAAHIAFMRSSKNARFWIVVDILREQ